MFFFSLFSSFCVNAALPVLTNDWLRVTMMGYRVAGFPPRMACAFPYLKEWKSHDNFTFLYYLYYKIAFFDFQNNQYTSSQHVLVYIHEIKLCVNTRENPPLSVR